MAPLQGALALAQVQHGAVGVGEHLDLDVPGGRDQPLDEQRGVAERAERLPAGARDRAGEVGGVVHLAHALAATARRRLEQHRVADAGRGGGQLGVRQCRTVRPSPDAPGTTGTPAAVTASRARILSPITAIAVVGGPTNTMPASARAAARSAFSDRKP